MTKNCLIFILFASSKERGFEPHSAHCFCTLAHPLSESHDYRSVGEGDNLIFVEVKPIFVQVRIGRRAGRAIQLGPHRIRILLFSTFPLIYTAIRLEGKEQY